MRTTGETLADWWNGLLALDPQELLVNAGASFLIVAAGFLVLWGAGLALRAAWRRLDHEWNQRTGRPKAVRWTWMTLQAAVILTGLATIAVVWGLDPLGWVRAGVGALILRLVLVVAFATAAVEVAGFFIDRGLRTLERRTSDPRRAAQLRTLAPLLRGVVHMVFVTMALMIILSELGVKIGPLLAGAGVVGIAVGFGAQTLVKDFLTGLFLIVEDIVSVGDVVGVGDVSGAVEQMTLRTIRLRSFDGTLHIIPYGETQVIHNMTKVFAYAVSEPLISYGSDADKALEIMRRVGLAVQADPALAPLILSEIEVVGVERLAESGVGLKARIKTRPGSQWTVGREYNRRLKAAFAAEGIEIPTPTMNLVTPETPAPAPAKED